MLQCGLILGLNIKAGIQHILLKKKSKIGKLDRILCLSLSLFDLTMGFYLLVIAVNYNQTGISARAGREKLE